MRVRHHALLNGLLLMILSGAAVCQASAEPSGLIHTWRGENGNAFYLDGSRAVHVPDMPSLDIPDGAPWTLEAWVLPASAQVQHIAGKRGPCGPGGFYQIGIDHNAPGTGMSIDQKDIPAFTWTHVALAMDGHTGWNVYANGALVKTVLAPNWKNRNSGPFLIGGSGTCVPFKGVIEEVSLFGRALSAAEVQARYATAKSGPKTPLAIAECENNECVAGKIGGNIASWTFQGPRGVALWPQARTASTLEVERFDRTGVVIRRTNIPGSAAAGLTAVYCGTLSGDEINGTVTWTWAGFKQGSAQGTWHAKVGSLQAQQELTKAQRAQFAALSSGSGNPAHSGLPPNFVAAMMLFGSMSGADDGNGVSKARINQLESQLLQAQHDCGALGPHGERAPESTCDRRDQIRSQLNTAQRDFNEETQALFAQQRKLAAECKGGSKPACDKEKVLIHQLNVRNGIPEGPPNTKDIWGSFSSAVQ